MKIREIVTRNFGGLGSIILSELDDHAEIFLSGRNGIGKSQLLLCIALATRSDLVTEQLVKYVAAGHSEAMIEVEFVLSRDEARRLRELVAERDDDSVNFSGLTLRSQLSFSTSHRPTICWSDEAEDSSITDVLVDPLARRKLPFLEVTFLPADRSVQRSPDLTLSLGSLARTESEANAEQVIQNAIGDWGSGHSFDVFSSLGAMHYAGILSDQDGKTSRNLRDFWDIVEAFERATGKRIEEPALQSDGNIGMAVSAPNGTAHGVNTLSTGELISLQLLHYVKLHFQRGSLLLIDEPEQHLHPSLQVELANAIRQGLGDGQLWTSTHSPNLLHAVSGKDVLVLSRNPNSGDVECNWANEASQRMNLLEDLGVAPGLWMPGNFILIVEGPSDERLLRLLLPDLLGAAFFVVAGDKSSVKQLSYRMSENQSIPFVAICDKDLEDEIQLEEWNSKPHQFMWSGYAIESIFLDREFLIHTLEFIGSKFSRERLDQKLSAAFNAQKSDVRQRWMKTKVLTEVPSRDDHQNEVREHYKVALRVAEERLEWITHREKELDAEFERLWNSGAERLVDPKRAMRQLEVGPYRRGQDLIQTMSTLLARGDYTSSDLNALREKIENLSRPKV